jgi:hypothetical protein
MDKLGAYAGWREVGDAGFCQNSAVHHQHDFPDLADYNHLAEP